MAVSVYTNPDIAPGGGHGKGTDPGQCFPVTDRPAVRPPIPHTLSMFHPRDARPAIIHVMQTRRPGYGFSVGNGLPSGQWTLDRPSAVMALPLALAHRADTLIPDSTVIFTRQYGCSSRCTDVSPFNDSSRLSSRSTAGLPTAGFGCCRRPVSFPLGLDTFLQERHEIDDFAFGRPLPFFG